MISAQEIENKQQEMSAWNVCGVNNPVKRGKVVTLLKSLASDIMFLQETDLKNSWHGRLRAKWIGEVYHSTFSSIVRDAVILLSKVASF